MLQKKPLVLIFDVGTQSTRALLFDKKGNLIKKIKVDEDLYISQQDNYAEKACSESWDGICESSRLLRESVGEEVWSNIIAVSVTTVRSTLAFLDKYYKPTRNYIIWLDKREVNCPDKLPLKNRLAYKLVGMAEVVRVNRKTCCANWVRINQPDVWAKTDKVVMISAYFNYKLTGRLADSTASQAARIPYDYKKRRWMTAKSMNYPIFGCEISKMCELVQPGERIGYITKQTAKDIGLPVGLPVIASGADKSCETIGAGCFDNDAASLSFGTAATIQITTRKYVEPENFLPAFTCLVPNRYNPEVQMYRGFWMVSWFKEQFAKAESERAQKSSLEVEKVLDAMLDSVPVGCSGLMLQPFWGPGLSTPEAKGTIIGFSDEHTRIYLYRAIIEGLGYSLLEGLERLEKRSKMKFQRLAVSGGGSQSDIVCQIMADIFGRELFRVQTYETSGLGAAMAVFMGMKEFDSWDKARDEMVHREKFFYPNLANTAKYKELYTRCYKKMYKNLKPIYDELYDILKQNRM